MKSGTIHGVVFTRYRWLLSELKRPECASDYSFSTSTEIEKDWSFISMPIVFIQGKH
jgi:hypothetical protein